MIGLSDHTNNIDSSLASVGLGAVAIEKHVKKNKNSKTLDSDFSITPNQLSQLKNQSINIFKSLGELQKENKIDKSIKTMRRSIYASRDIEADEPITSKNIDVLRPRLGIPSEEYFKVIKKKAKKKIRKNTPIKWSFLYK